VKGVWVSDDKASAYGVSTLWRVPRAPVAASHMGDWVVRRLGTHALNPCLFFRLRQLGLYCRLGMSSKTAGSKVN